MRKHDWKLLMWYHKFYSEIVVKRMEYLSQWKKMLSTSLQESQYVPRFQEMETSVDSKNNHTVKRRQMKLGLSCESKMYLSLYRSRVDLVKKYYSSVFYMWAEVWTEASLSVSSWRQNIAFSYICEYRGTYWRRIIFSICE